MRNIDFNLLERMDQILETKKSSRKQMANDLNMTTSTMSSWNKQRMAIPNSLVLLNIADYLGVSMEYLLTGEEFSNEYPIDIKLVIDNLLQLPEEQRKPIIASIIAQTKVLKELNQEREYADTTAGKEA